MTGPAGFLRRFGKIPYNFLALFRICGILNKSAAARERARRELLPAANGAPPLFRPESAKVEYGESGGVLVIPLYCHGIIV